MKSKLGGQYIRGNAVANEEALKILGQQLKEKRLTLNATQAQVEAHSGVSVTVVKRLESGKPISTENLVKILKAYGALADLLRLFEPEQMNLEDQWHLLQKNQKTKRKRASSSIKAT